MRSHPVLQRLTLPPTRVTDAKSLPQRGKVMQTNSLAAPNEGGNGGNHNREVHDPTRAPEWTQGGARVTGFAQSGCRTAVRTSTTSGWEDPFKVRMPSRCLVERAMSALHIAPGTISTGTMLGTDGNLLGTSFQSVQVSVNEHSCGLALAGQYLPSMGHSAWFVRDEPVRRVRSAACACSTRDNERGIPSRAAVALSDERAMSTLVW